MDGTLLRGTTASLEIARHLGCLPELLQLESSFRAGIIDTRGFASEIYQLWHGLTSEITRKAFVQAPWIGGLTQVLADISQRGERSMVITMSPDFFARHLIALGVNEVTASAFPPLPLRRSPDPTRILTPADKVLAMDRARATLGFDRESCVAYGDSSSDIPLFQSLNNSIAINATQNLKRIAKYQYDGDDLLIAYRMIVK
jgi:phosphoserine phosphatase